MFIAYFDQQYNPVKQIQNINLAPIKPTYKVMMIDKVPIVSLTGFGLLTQEKHAQIHKKIEAIGCKFIENITNATDVLIVNKTSTEKYQIAELPISKMQSVTEKWLNDSYKSKKILETKKYRIIKIFYGVRVGIIGFEKEKLDKIQKALKENGALLQPIQINLQSTQTQQLPDVIISTRSYLKKMDIYAKKISVPIVQLQWLEQSLAQKLCKFPKNYALNLHYISSMTSGIKQIPRIIKKLQKILQIQIDSLPKILANEYSHPFIIYLDPNTIPKDLITYLKKIICLYGGIYIETLNPILTHSLVGDIAQKQYLNMIKEIGSGQIFRVEWLIDTILFGCKMFEIDYKVRGFRQKKDSLQFQMNTNSFSFQNSFIHLNRQNSLNESNRKTIGPVQTPKSVKIMKVKVVKTQIFKNSIFFIESNQRKATQMMSIPTKIKQNGGVIYDNPYKNKRNYLVMKDSEFNAEIIQDYIKNYPKIEIIPVSVRWIDYCIKKGVYISHDTEGAMIFKPFSFKTPISDFMRMKFDILGLDEIFSKRLRQLLSVLGSSKATPNKSQLTHCLCGRQYKETDRYRQIRKQNKFVKFLKYEWILYVVNNNGRIDKIDQFQVQIDEESSSLQESQKIKFLDDAKTPEKLGPEKYHRQLPTQQRQQNEF